MSTDNSRTHVAVTFSKTAWPLFIGWLTCAAVLGAFGKACVGRHAPILLWPLERMLEWSSSQHGNWGIQVTDLPCWWWPVWAYCTALAGACLWPFFFVGRLRRASEVLLVPLTLRAVVVVVLLALVLFIILFALLALFPMGMQT